MTNAAAILAPIPSTYEAFGCRVNAINVDELFRRYEQAGFLYPSKIRRLAPYWELVRDNWRKALRGGELIHYVVTANLPDGAWASITSWRSTNTGWNTQHLIGSGGPAASRAAMLSTQAVRIQDQLDGSHQNWFQRNNRFANKVFGSICVTLGDSIGWVGDYSYFAIASGLCKSASERVQIRQARAHDASAIRELAERVRSAVYFTAEELDDPQLEAVDELYRKVGLRRYRRLVVAEVAGHDGLAGIALAYRGPLGLNFSFLENRCDLLMAPDLSTNNRRAVVNALVIGSAEHYADFPLKAIPVLIEKAYADDVRSLGGEYVRDYAQCIWLRDGFEPWYRHIEQLYDRAMRAQLRHGLSAKLAVRRQGEPN